MSGYTGGFNAAAPTVSFITTLKLGNGTVLAGSESGFVANPYMLTSNGGLASYTRAGNITRTNGTMVIEDVYGNADAIIGRWNNGTNTGANTFTLNANSIANEHPTIGSATAHESGALGTTIGWTRWAGGTTGGQYFSDTDGITFTDNQGWHLIVGDPATNLPASSVVTYALAGATAPTIRSGRAAPGVFSGGLGVSFGRVSKVGLYFKVSIDGSSYGFDTPGGVVAPQLGLTVNSDNTFVTSTALAVNGTGSVCPVGNCTAQARGFLAGSGASAVGIAYIFNNCLGFNTTVDGVAAFSKVP
jgi:hypothetical protein